MPEAFRALEVRLEGIDIVERARLADVAAVEERMDARGFHAVFFRLLEHGFEMIDVRMDVAVREKPDEVELGTVFVDVRHEFFPVSPANIAPESMDAETSFAPCANTLPQPIAL